MRCLFEELLTKLSCTLLVKKNDLVSIHREILTGAEYKEVPRDVISRYASSVYEPAKKLAKSIASLENENGLKFALRPGPTAIGSKLQSRLVLTCKSHKGPGKVEFRNIHSSLGYPLEGLSRWLARELEAALDKTQRPVLREN